MDRLIVKNFGPLKDVDIELNKINLFIGENGSGKSVLGKLVTIILSLEGKVRGKENEEEIFFKKFQEYYIDFITNETIIHLLIKEKLELEIKDKKMNLPGFYFSINPKKSSGSSDIWIGNELRTQYIPAERNLISIFNKYVTTFITADIPLPKFLLNFSSQYVRAREEIRALDFLNVKYKFQNDQERIFYNDKDFLLLEQSSSGIQSALPLYLTVKYFAQKHKSIIIEEPEQNLFPKAQKETIEYIVEQISDKNNLFMMTHSPYVLTALNNLILANDVKTQKGVEAIDGIVKQEQCVAFEEVSAYSLIDGKSINIMDKEDRLIGVNLIDSISDEVSDTFDKLLAKLD
jgi:predicted ATPase